MNLSNYEQANYQHLQDRLEQWQRYDFEKQLNNKLYNVLKRVNWHKNIFVKKHTTLKIGSLISVLNGNLSSMAFVKKDEEGNYHIKPATHRDKKIILQIFNSKK